MTLQAILDYFGNPMGKMYNPESGTVAIPMGGYAGEIYYLRIHCFYGKWKPDKRSSSLDKAGWLPAIGVTEEDLVAMSKRYWDEDV